MAVLLPAPLGPHQAVYGSLGHLYVQSVQGCHTVKGLYHPAHLKHPIPPPFSGSAGTLFPALSRPRYNVRPASWNGRPARRWSRRAGLVTAAMLPRIEYSSPAISSAGS